MSGRKARQVRRSQAPVPRSGRSSRRGPWFWPVVALVVVAAIVGGVFAARGNGPAQALSVSNGNTLKLSGTNPIDGKNVSLADFAGKPIVLNAWGSWCTGCRAEARDLAQFAVAHPEVQVVGVDSTDTRSTAKAFYREFGWQHPSIEDRTGALAASLGVQGFPTTFFLDRNHRIVTQIIGATDRAGFERGLEAALKS
ncbi:MAG: TlpA disulfide reductase family protein [Gaiellaceae bacterium]